MNDPIAHFSWRVSLCSLAGLMLCAGAALAQVGDKVRLPAFAIDRTEVTIGQFDCFVCATGTVTRAEKEGMVYCGLPVRCVSSIEPSLVRAFHEAPASDKRHFSLIHL